MEMVKTSVGKTGVNRAQRLCDNDTVTSNSSNNLNFIFKK